jgi:hypothetical protein
LNVFRIGENNQAVEALRYQLNNKMLIFLLENLRKFQQFYGLNVTGKMEQETSALMNLSRCGVADILDYAK